MSGRPASGECHLSRMISSVESTSIRRAIEDLDPDSEGARSILYTPCKMSHITSFAANHELNACDWSSDGANPSSLGLFFACMSPLSCSVPLADRRHHNHQSIRPGRNSSSFTIQSIPASSSRICLLKIPLAFPNSARNMSPPMTLPSPSSSITPRT